MITKTELWLVVEVVAYIVIFTLWDKMMISFGADPTTYDAIANVLLAVAVVFGFRIAKLTEKVESLEGKTQNENS